MLMLSYISLLICVLLYLSLREQKSILVKEVGGAQAESESPLPPPSEASLLLLKDGPGTDLGSPL